MKEEDNGEGEEGRESERGTKQDRAPSDENDGVVSEGNNSGEEEDHEVAKDSETGA